MAREVENEAGSGLIAWISAGLNVTNVFMRAAGTVGRKLSPVFVRAGSHLGNAATVGAVAYEVYSEESLTHKGERAGAGIAAAGVNIALGTAAASAGEAAAVTGVVGATGATVVAAAAPLVLAGVAAGTTAKVADLAIETRRTYEALDRSLAEQAAPQKIRKRPDGEKPSFLDYKHLVGLREVTAHMRDEALHTSVPIERFAGSGAIKNIRVLDMSLPQNLREYERALNAEIERQTAIKTANDSYMPRWLRGGDSVDQYNVADIELQHLLGAREELAMFRRDLLRYNERHPSGDIAKATGHGSDEKREIAAGFNAAHTGVEEPRNRVAAGEIAAPGQRPVKPLTPG